MSIRPRTSIGQVLESIGHLPQGSRDHNDPDYIEGSITYSSNSSEQYALTPAENEPPYAFAPSNLRGGTDSTQAPSGPTLRDEAPPPRNDPPPVSPIVAEFERLWREVNHELDKRLPTLTDISAQNWKEQLVSAGNLIRRKPPDYQAGCEALENIKQALEQKSGAMDRESYDNVCEQFRATLEQSAPLVGDTTLGQVKTFLLTQDEVKSGELEMSKAVPLIVTLEREVKTAHDIRLREIMGVVADYERLEPIVARAEQSLDGPTAPSQSGKVKEAHGGFKAFVRRLPVLGQFFPKESGMSAPPPRVPRLSDIRKTVTTGFSGAFQAHDLESIRKQLGALETLAKEALANIDINMEIKKQQQRLPVDAKDLKKTKELGSGNFAKTYLVTGPETEVPADPNVPDGPTVKQQQKFAAKYLKSTKEEALQSIDKEVEAYARLGEHPNIAKCYGKQKIGTETVLVMELVEGQSAQEVFGDLLRRYNKGELNRSEYLGAMQHIIHGILMGLSQFEALGLAHLDIKADNIRIDSNTHEPKILDMGLVQSQDEALPDVPVPIKWMAPETMAKREVGPTSDSFGLGQTIFQQLERGGQFGSEATNAWQRQETDLKNLAAGPMFVPGKGTVNDGGNLYNRDFAHFDRQALTESGLPTAMPLTRASDQKLGNTPRAHGADPGKFGVETQYVDFMNRLMHPDPKLRMTPSEALRHPFMTDRLMSREELAKSVFPAKEAVQSNAANIEIDYDVQDVHQPPPRDEIVYLDEEDEQPPPPDSRKIDYTISQQDNDDYDKGNRQ